MLIVLIEPVEAAARAQQCRQQCGEEIARCLDTALARLVAGDEPERCLPRLTSRLQRACRRGTLERCRQEGVRTCLPVTSVPDYSGEWEFVGILADTSCPGEIADLRSEEIRVSQDGTSFQAQFVHPPRVAGGRESGLTPAGFHLSEEYRNLGEPFCSNTWRLDVSGTGMNLSATFTSTSTCPVPACTSTYDGTLACRPRACGCGTSDTDADGNGVADCLTHAEVRDRLDRLTTAVRALRRRCATPLAAEVDRLLAELIDFVAANNSLLTLLGDAQLAPLTQALQTKVLRAAQVRGAEARQEALKAIEALDGVLGED